MLDNDSKEKVKALLSEAVTLLTTKQELTKTINKVLKKDEIFVEMMAEKKSLDEKIKEYQEQTIGNLIEEKNRLTENLKIIKEDITEDMEIKKTITNKLVSFYKTKYEKNEDQLDVLTTAWIELFDLEV